MKIKRFRTLEKRWIDDVRTTNPTHSFLEIEQYCNVSGNFQSISIHIKINRLSGKEKKLRCPKIDIRMFILLKS